MDIPVGAPRAPPSSFPLHPSSLVDQAPWAGAAVAVAEGVLSFWGG